MSFQYMALYTGDYLRDTRALSLAEHGCYLLLLMHYWDAREPLPLDEQELSAICNARSAGEVDSMRKVLGKYFVKMDDGFYNQRMQREIEKASAISKMRGKSGRLGGQARAKHLPSKSQASASNTTTTTTTNTTTTKSKALSGKPDAVAILQFLNEKAGREYQPVAVNLEKIEARLREGYTVADLRQIVAKKCRDWGADDKMRQYLRPATLFNREKAAQYRGELVTPKETHEG